MPSKIGKIIGALSETREGLKKLESLLATGPATFYFERIVEYIDGLFSFSQFKMGERVCLVKDIDCNDKSGWISSAHFLKKGATAVVHDLDYYGRGFRYGIVFDNDTWLDSKGIAHASLDKGQFWFSEHDLAKVSK